MKALIKKVPIPTAGVALGLAALGILLQPYSEVLHSTAGILSLGLILLLGAKIVLYPRMIREDLKNSVFASTLGTLFMTIMQLATYLAPYLLPAALVVWSTAVFAHAMLIVWFTLVFIGRFDLKQVFPSYFIAYVGIITASLTSPVFGMEALGVALFWFGLASALALLVLVTYRYVKHEVAEPFKPLFCIYAAPVALSLAGYLAVSPEPAAVLVIGMTLAAQCSLIVVLTRLPKLLRLKFYPSYAAMAFPFVVSAVALTKATAYFASMGAPEILLTALGGLVAVETVFAAVMVLFVFVHYLCFFAGRARGTQTKPAEAV